MLRIRTASLISVLVLACNRAETPGDSELLSASDFVTGFYGWYVTSVRHGTAWSAVIQDSAHLFAPELSRQLLADAAVQAANPDEIVGLDGDPFLNAQDFCDTYSVGTAHHDGSAMTVEVRGDCWERPGGHPDVVPELVRSGSRWVFVNFRYPDQSTDLLQVLSRLRALRETAR